MLHETVVIIYFFRQVIYMFFLKEISNKKCEGGGTSWASNSAPSCALVIRTLIWINLYWSQLFPSLSFCCLDRYPKWLELLFIAATWHFGIPLPAKLPRTLLSKLKTSHLWVRSASSGLQCAFLLLQTTFIVLQTFVFQVELDYRLGENRNIPLCRYNYKTGIVMYFVAYLQLCK